MNQAFTNHSEDTAARCCSDGHENTIRRVAGGMILASLLLAWFIHPGWLGLAAFVGLNLFQSSFTGICPLNNILGWLHRRQNTAA
jgi:hypothetical protein